MRITFVLASLIFLTGGVLSGEAAHATEDEFNLADGLYAGTVRAPRGPRLPVTLELRQEALMMADRDEVTVGRVNFVRVDEAVTDGRTTFKGTWSLGGAMTIAGKGRRVSRTEAPVALTLWPDGRAVFCHPVGPRHEKDEEIRVPPGAAMPGPRTRCLDLGRTQSLATAIPEPIPPVPTRAWEDPVAVCIASCVADAQEEAESAAAITARCRTKCTPIGPRRVLTPVRQAP